MRLRLGRRWCRECDSSGLRGSSFEAELDPELGQIPQLSPGEPTYRARVEEAAFGKERKGSKKCGAKDRYVFVGFFRMAIAG